MNTTEKNKETVKRFNKEVIELGNLNSFNEIMGIGFVNRTAAPTLSDGADGMWHMLNNILRPAFPDLVVEIYDQLAEGDKVTTRKAIMGTHTGTLMGIPPTNRKIRIDVIDIVRVQDGKYMEHWGLNTLQTLMAELKIV